MTPIEFQNLEKYPVYIVINGGFFNMDTGDSESLIINEFNLISPNMRQLQNYYPTRGAFGMYDNRQFEGSWVYTPSNSSTTYAYDKPANNSHDRPPLPEPNSTWPQGAKAWKVQEAIGGIPLLIKNGVYVDGSVELYSQSFFDRNPRSAICKTKDNKLILFAADGRSQISGGLMLNETAQILLSLGCVEALNLDGGGSTCMVSNGKIANHPSDTTGPRKVASALMIMANRL